MNEEMFFYPLYPFENEDNGYLNEFDYRNESNLFTPKETLIYGNIFRNQYASYMHYKPYKINIPNRNSVLSLMAIEDYKHDLKLYLDIFPNDKKILEEYQKACLEYDEIKKTVSLEERKCPMCNITIQSLNQRGGYNV